MASNVVYVSDFTTSKISISAPKVLESGAKQAYLNYDSGRLTLQTATNLSVPFGLSVYDKSGPAEYSVELSFRGYDTNGETKQFFDAMTSLDAYMIEQGVKNCKQWFKSDLSQQVVKAFYTPSVRFSKDKDGNPQPYPPTIKLKLRKPGGEFEAKFFDVKGNAYKGVPVEDLLVKGVQVTALMECAGVWFAGSKFGLTWRAKQIVIHRLPERVPEFSAFRLGAAASEPVAVAAPVSRSRVTAPLPSEADDEEENNLVDDDEALASASAPAPALGRAQSVVAAVLPVAVAQAPAPVEEHEDGEEVEPVPVPKKPVLKKKPVVAAKKA